MNILLMTIYTEKKYCFLLIINVWFTHILDGMFGKPYICKTVHLGNFTYVKIYISETVHFGNFHLRNFTLGKWCI